jgi:hypothetical protein
VGYIGLLRPAARISQTHASRLRTRALGYLRSHLLDPQEHASCHRGILAATEP